MAPPGHRKMSASTMSISHALTREFLNLIQDNKTARRIRIAKLVVIFAVPVVALTVLAAMQITVALRVREQSSILSSSVATSVQISLVITSLARERGMTSEEAWEKLASYRKASLESVEAVSEWPGSETDGPAVASRKAFLSSLLSHRLSQRDSNRTSIQEVFWYKELVESVMLLMNKEVKLTGDSGGQLWKMLFALELLVRSKESLGIQRAVGSAYFGKGFNTPVEKAVFREHYWKSRNFLTLCQDHSIKSEEAIRYLSKDKENLISTLASMRDVILQNRNTPSTPQTGLIWFGNMTIYIDSLAAIENGLVIDITAQLDSQQNAARRELVEAITFLTLALVLCPPLCVWYFRSLNIINHNISSAAKALATEATELTAEKKRGEKLLQRLLPPFVVEALKKGVPVAAEQYDATTIYFSDIVGFTKISAKSTPLQVIDLLNRLYTDFDAELNSHDVYKVETIGDAYMVVSGIPLRNGDAHGGEIATLALELRGIVTKFCIPHLKNEKLALRIGIHTGSVLAGVVGRRMPRYCLFGQTVLTAEQMEQTGLPMRIHVSHSSNQLLMKIGGFELVKRDTTYDLKTDAANGNGETYWLLQKVEKRHRVSDGVSHIAFKT